MEKTIDYFRVLSTLSDLYVSLFYYNLNDDSLIGIKSNRFIDTWSSEYEGARDKTVNVMKNIAVDRDREMMAAFVDTYTLNERMAEKKVLIQDFEGKINGQCRAIWIEVDRNADSTLRHVIFLVESL